MFRLLPHALPSDYGEGILSLEEAKDQCSVEQSESEFDDLIAAFRDAAVEHVERICGVALAPKEGLVCIAESVWSGYRLPVTPVTAVSGFAYLDSSGVSQAFDVVGLRVGRDAALFLANGATWPSVYGGVTITFDAGFTNAERPRVLVQAVRVLCAHLFKHREAVASGTTATEIPLGFHALCGTYRPMDV